jgi:hypothetical protein
MQVANRLGLCEAPNCQKDAAPGARYCYQRMHLTPLCLVRDCTSLRGGGVFCRIHEEALDLFRSLQPEKRFFDWLKEQEGGARG